MNLEPEIAHVLAKLMSNDGDPREVLRNFAKAVRDEGCVTVERLVPKCASCDEPGAICFRCKAMNMVGERGMAAAPMLLPKLGQLVTKWASEWKSRRSRKAATQEGSRRRPAQQPRRPPPPPGGRQTF